MRSLWPIALVLGLAASTPPTTFGQTLKLEGRALGAPLIIEAAGRGDELETKLRTGWAEAADLVRFLDPATGVLPQLNAAAGDGPRRVDERILALISRASFFCEWSENRHGPLGGWLYEGWGLRTPVERQLVGDDLKRAVQLSGCRGLAVSTEAGTLAMAEERKLELWGFQRGFVIDRVAVVLEEQGLSDFTVTLGTIQRSMGSDPGGDGWPVTFEAPETTRLILEGLRLRDQSLAIVTGGEATLDVAGASFPAYLNHRLGAPASGIVAVGTVADLALDAQAIAVTSFVGGSRDGMFLAGRFDPMPAIRWLLGKPGSEPLVSDFHWSAVKLPR